MFAIESYNIDKFYKGSKKKALDDVSLKIESGKISTILGRNGAGKTTFVPYLLYNYCLLLVKYRYLVMM